VGRRNRDSKNGKWTVHDIARVAGVSAKTVSRVVNDEPGVSAETRVRISKIIEKVDYHPHMGARSMRRRSLDSVGVTVPAPMEEVPVNLEFLVWLFAELYRVFSEQQYFICWDLKPPRLGGAVDYARGLWQQRYSGCIIAGPLATNDTTIRRIHESGCPYVVLGRLDSLPEVSHAAVDYQEATHMSARFLLGRGHTRIGMLKALAGYQPGVERRRGYLCAIEEAGLAPSEDLIRPVSFDSRDIANTTHRLLLDPKVTAVIDCSGAEDAASIRKGAQRAGRVPGKDFEVVCWTYTHNVIIMSEACAHVWLPVREAAAEGFDLLARWFRQDREGPIQILYRPTLYDTPAGDERLKPKHLFDMLA
jgi:LacI family transcriptional regulator